MEITDIKSDFFQNTCYKELSNMVVVANLWVTIFLKNVFQSSHGIKNIHQSKLYQWYTHLGRTFLQLPLLRVWETFHFRQSTKVCSIILSTWVFFAFLGKRRRNRYCLREEKLVFHMQIFSLMWQSVNLFWKIAV